MSPTVTIAPVSYIREQTRKAHQEIEFGAPEQAIAILDEVIEVGEVAVLRIGNALDPASLVITAATQGLTVARRALNLHYGWQSQAVGAVQAVSAILNAVPAIIEAPSEPEAS